MDQCKCQNRQEAESQYRRQITTQLARGVAAVDRAVDAMKGPLPDEYYELLAVWKSRGRADDQSPPPSPKITGKRRSAQERQVA